MKLPALYKKVEQFTFHKLMPAVATVGSLSKSEREAIARQEARYTGLSERFILNYNLVVPAGAFWKELLRKQGKTIGRLDMRYAGIDAMNAGVRPTYSAELEAWDHEFAPAMNYYIRQVLGFNPNLQYNVFGPVHPWPMKNDHVVSQLRKAMEENPALHLFNSQGYFDAACTVAAAQYTLWQLDANGKLKNRITFKAYPSGHMFYIRKKMMIEGNNDLRKFIKNSIPKKGQPIKYNNVPRKNLGN